MRLRISAAIAVSALCVGGHAAVAQAPAANQVVAAVPEAVVGFSVSSAGATPSNTIAVDVRRERLGDETIVTVTPRD
jgi:hypothetical protein